MKHIEHIVNEVHRPFSYSKDFSHMMSHGTFRNKISKLVRKGIVIVDYWSTCAFYTLPGHRFGKPMTPLPYGGLYTPYFPSYRAKSLYALINNLPLSKNSLHDIRLTFKVEKIWSILSRNSAFRVNSRNKDIRMPGIKVDDLFIGMSVHRTDTITVDVGCSYVPIAVDIPGVIRLSNALTIVEERLSQYLREAGAIQTCIPKHMTWILTMWHFGADSRIEFDGEKFQITYTEAEGILSRIYSKRFKDGKVRLRLELQELPQMSLIEAIENKLNTNNNAGQFHSQ